MIELKDFTGFEYYGEVEQAQQAEDEAEMATYREFDAYQDFTDTTAIYPEERELEYLMMGLVSEVGEMAGKVKKEIRDGTEFTDEDFVKELGDVLWYVARLAAHRDIFLSDVAFENIDKLSSRKERNTLGGSGDER